MHDYALEQGLMPPEVASFEEIHHLAPPISDRHGFVTSADRTGLFFRFWPAESWNGRVVIVLHGIGYHSAPYKVIANAINPDGTHVYAFDARGHGLSQGRRGFVGSPAEIVADVEAMVQHVREEYPNAKIFLLGDSMGADLVLCYAKSHGGELAGLVLLAPALDLHPSQYFSLESIQLFPNLIFAMRKSVINLLNSRLDESTRDEDFVLRRRADPLAYKSVSFGYLLDAQRLVWDWRWAIAPKVTAPILIIRGGEDRVVSHGQCISFYRRSAAKDKRLEVFPEVAHTTLWDPQSPEILNLVGQWVLEH